MLASPEIVEEMGWLDMHDEKSQAQIFIPLQAPT
jgi:hypothetical protein